MIRQGLASLYGALSGGHQRLYDCGIFSSHRLSVPVISIGNLTVGGTGKTPVTSFCLSLLQERGHHPGLVVRSYRTGRKKPGRVDPQQPFAEADFGDEAVWFAKKHPRIPVWSGPRKLDTARALASRENIDVILVDDGFQHRALARDLNLLLLDSTDGPHAYRPLPWGRAREPYSGISRAQAILWTKSNLGSSPEMATPSAIPVFHFDSVLKLSETFEGNTLLVSGIARPESFEQLVREASPKAILSRLDFPDHHPYTEADLPRILEAARRGAVQRVLTTEKDEGKLRPLWPVSGPPLIALPLEVRLRESVESFYELLRQPLLSRA